MEIAMHIPLPPEYEAFIEDQISSGHYVAVYRVVDQEKAVFLHMITHGARDRRRLLQERSPVND